MKKILLVAICILTLCLLNFAEPASSHSSTYSHTCYVQDSSTSVTIDGGWTSSSEWTDGWADTFGNTTVSNCAVFRDKYYVVSTSPITVNYYMLIESNDTTADAGDYWQLCFDTNDTASNRVDDIRIDITGHSPSQTVQFYQGSGVSSWAAISTPTSSAFQFAETKVASTAFAAAHYILEVQILKTSTEFSFTSQFLNQTFAMRVAYFDAHTGGYGTMVWPPSASRDDPNVYGYIPYNSTALPESLNLAIIIALSSVAIAAGIVLQKRSKIAKMVKKPNGIMT